MTYERISRRLCFSACETVASHTPSQVALDTELQRRGLQDLVAYLLGCDASVVRHELCRLSDMCAQQRLQLDHFVCALVGAAVTLWALEPVSQGPTDPGYKALEKALQDGE